MKNLAQIDKVILAAVTLSIVTIMAWLIFQKQSEVAVNQVPDTNDPFILGQYYFNQGDSPSGAYDLEKARHYFTEAIETDPKGNSLSWYQLGRIDFLEGNFNAAIYKFKKQQQYFDDDIPNVYYMLGLTYAYQARREEIPENWSLAEENFKKYLDFFPDSPWARTDLSWIYFSQGKFEEMIPILEIGLVTEPDNPWLRNMYGLALLNTGKPEEADKQFIRALEDAEKLTVEDWGKSYPGNDPKIWDEGLSEFKAAIRNNLTLSER